MDPGRFRPQAPAVPGPPPPPPRTRREGETPEGPHDPANGELVPCEASSPLPQPAAGLGPLPRGSPGRAPHREEAERPLRPRSRRRHGESAAPRPSPASGLGGSRRGFGHGWLRGALCEAPRFPLYSGHYPRSSASPRSKEHMFPLGLLARLTTSHGQGKAAPGTKAESGIWNVNARGSSDGGCRRKRSFSPFSVLGRRFSVSCRYRNAALLPAQVSRGTVSIPLRVIPEQMKHVPGKRLTYIYVELSDPGMIPKSSRR